MDLKRFITVSTNTHHRLHLALTDTFTTHFEIILPCPAIFSNYNFYLFVASICSKFQTYRTYIDVAILKTRI
jgi:hypothetical protein